MPPEVVLLISNYEKNDRWCQWLREALDPLDLEIRCEKAALGCVAGNRYILIIVDAAATDDAAHLIRSLRSHQPEAPIIVFSASPTWERAREAFRAGAMDYVRKPIGREEMRMLFIDMRARVLPSSPNWKR